ncbi:L-threonylcarbamoyladenylate synthase [Catenovulum sediminis]|uniref:Threonylcarbamoyl-AMP synthase n=1 Tax=Catenovulum sediminis TaxID=1740262 RepID=A0ABV1REF3_9ALTE|nr:L-threonylcarbamoyladenylate synthase [Catenovulum sediminis]
MSDTNINTHIIQKLLPGEVIAYPTESCFGLGCHPLDEAAVMKVLDLKQRPVNKGVILIASDYSQLLPYVDDNKIPQDKRFSVFSHWPGAVTLLLPANKSTPKFLTGDFDTIAVRVTAHQAARDLCRQLGHALVSTSANLSGQPSATSASQVKKIFAHRVDHIVEEGIGRNPKPSKILNPLTGEVFRA